MKWCRPGFHQDHGLRQITVLVVSDFVKGALKVYPTLHRHHTVKKVKDMVSSSTSIRQEHMIWYFNGFRVANDTQFRTLLSEMTRLDFILVRTNIEDDTLNGRAFGGDPIQGGDVEDSPFLPTPAQVERAEADGDDSSSDSRSHRMEKLVQGLASAARKLRQPAHEGSVNTPESTFDSLTSDNSSSSTGSSSSSFEDDGGSSDSDYSSSSQSGSGSDSDGSTWESSSPGRNRGKRSNTSAWSATMTQRQQMEAHIRNQTVNALLTEATVRAPEYFGDITMLYIKVRLNQREVFALIDTGAQSSVISYDLVLRLGLAQTTDTRFSGTATGVGTAVIIGRIHLAPLVIGKYTFHLPMSVIGDGSIGCLLGLDFLRRYDAALDIGKNKVTLRNPASTRGCFGRIGTTAVPLLKQKHLPSKLL